MAATTNKIAALRIIPSDEAQMLSDHASRVQVRLPTHRQKCLLNPLYTVQHIGDDIFFNT